MDVAKTYAQQSCLQHSSFFVTTRAQTQGRGRLGRVWLQSSQDDFLPVTLALAKGKLSIPLEWVSLMVGVAVYDTLFAIYKYLIKKFQSSHFLKHDQINLVLKWPNDIVWYENKQIQKLAGVLCEAQIQTGIKNFSHVFIGIGLNFFSHPNLNDVCSFIEKILNKKNHLLFETETRNDVLKQMHLLLANNLEKYLCVSHSVEKMKRFFMSRTFSTGTKLSINKNKNHDAFYGIENDGALILKTQTNEIKKIYSAEIIELMNHNKNILCIDFGNTRIHMKAKNSYGYVYHAHISYFDLKLEKSIKCFESIFKLFRVKDIKNIHIFYVSVNSKEVTKESVLIIKNRFKKLKRNLKITLKKVTEKNIFKHFLIPKTFDHKTLGADRALKCVFGYQKAQEIGKNVLIVSFGTATTCEGFSKDGIMIENFVLPGMQMSLDALHHFTALLPKISAKKLTFSNQQKYWTQKAYLKRGVLLSAVSTIFVAAKFHQPCHVILTGGNVDIIKQTLIQISSKDILDTSNIEIIENIETGVLMDIASKMP